MKRIVITGYNDRNDGPSVFITTLTKAFKKKFHVHNIQSSFTLNDFYELIKSDVVILNSNNSMPLLVCFILIFLPQKKVLGVMHGGGRGVASYIRNLLFKINIFSMTTMSEFIVFVSNMQKTKLSEKFNKNQYSKFRVIPNGIDFNALKKYHNSNKLKYIIYAGGESEEKGRLLLDDIISKISQNFQYKDYKLIATGMDSELNYRVGCLEVEYRRKMIHSDFLKLLSESEIFLSLSPEETYGIACAEAAFLKLKVVCSKQCGFIETTPRVNIFTSDQHNPDCYYNALCLSLNTKLIDFSNFDSFIDVNKMIAMYLNLIQFKAVGEVGFDPDKRH